MRIYRSLDQARAEFAPSVLTIGNFDGVHAAHRELMRNTLRLARECDGKPSVLTFDPHPTAVVAPERAPLLLSSPAERCALMERMGIEQVLILPFGESISTLSPAGFFDEIVAGALGARAVAVGENFLFGRDQSGNVDTLRMLGERAGVRVEIVPAVRRRGVVVSSSQIRRLLAAGDVAMAARLLERPFAVSGRVVAGAGRGRRETVPTLNLEIPSLALEHAAVPANGVYITWASEPDSKRGWRAVTNVGTRPTFDGQHLTIETYLLDALTGESPENLKVEFLRRIRGEQRFESPEALKSQILKDVARAQTFFRRAAGVGGNRSY